jgi:hypothetical protein
VAYGLDPVGNRTSVSSGISGLSPVAGSFNPDDELSAESYDQNGNVTATGGKTFAYNSQNQLISMGGTVSIVYDGDGNRVAKTVSGVTTKYLVDDLNPTGYPQVVDELTNGAVSRTYAYGLQRIDEDQIISSAWTPSFYGYDGFGSVRQLTNVSGTVTDTYEYDAFGNKFTVSGSTPNNYLYRGEQFDLGPWPLLPPRQILQPPDGPVHEPVYAPKVMSLRGPGDWTKRSAPNRWETVDGESIWTN